ncbi:MAG: Succinyl-CoA synthetase, alpha subunit, partial [uncultured Solirubrobacteraceae bacterium]
GIPSPHARPAGAGRRGRPGAARRGLRRRPPLERALRHVQRLAEPQRRGPAPGRPRHGRQRAGPQRRGDDPARAPRRRPHQRVRLRRGRGQPRPLRRELPRGGPGRRGADPLPVPLHGRVEHGNPDRPGPQQQRRGGRRRRRVRLRPLPGPVRDGGLLALPHRRGGHPHVPALPLEGHAGQPAAHGLLRRGRAGGPAPELQVALGHPDRARRPHRPPAGLASDAADVRRPRGPQRAAQPRRDPVLGRLRAPQPQRLHLRRRGQPRRPAPPRALRHRRRPERRPRGRRLLRRRHPAAPGSPQDPGPAAHEPRRARAGGAPGRGEPRARGRSGVRHGRLLRPRARQPARGLRAAVPAPEGPRRRRLLAQVGRPAVPPGGDLPVPHERPPAGLGGRPPV